MRQGSSRPALLPPSVSSLLSLPLQSPLDCKEIILKEISPKYLFERTDAEAETPILWPPDAKK